MLLAVELQRIFIGKHMMTFPSSEFIEPVMPYSVKQQLVLHLYSKDNSMFETKVLIHNWLWDILLIGVFDPIWVESHVDEF
jgi:hypothetical protein